MPTADQEAVMKLATGDLTAFRAMAETRPSDFIKARILAIQQAVNAMDFSKPVSDIQRAMDVTILEGLLRRQSILRSIMESRFKHKDQDLVDFNNWLEKEAKVKRVF